MRPAHPPIPAHAPLADTRRGSTAVEFAIILPFLALTALALLQLSAFLEERQKVVQATYETARYAASSEVRPTEAQLQAYAVQVLNSQRVDSEGLVLRVDHKVLDRDPVIEVGLRLPVRLFSGALPLPAWHQQQFTLVERPDRS